MIDAFTGAFGWFQIPEKSNQSKHVKEHIDAADFFLNRAKSKTGETEHKIFQQRFTGHGQIKPRFPHLNEKIGNHQ